MRYWNNSGKDDGSVHCLGNGRLAVYEQGPNVIQVFGPPYSSPSFMEMFISDKGYIEVMSEREKGTAIWKHQIHKDGKCIGEITDFVDCKLACFIRRIDISQTLNIELQFENNIKIIDNSSRYDSFNINKALLAFAQAGTYIYGTYPSPIGLYQQTMAEGNINIENSLEAGVYNISCQPGVSTIYISGGPTYPECIEHSEGAINTSYDQMLDRTRNWWKVFTERRIDFNKIIPQNVPEREKLLDTIDDVAVIIKTQQSIEGGVLAGYKYHLGYVRDQYGVSRGLIKLGYYDEAKAMLRFYWNVWKRYGFIRNAQGLGVDNIFHVHENDDVEITGYLIIQAFNYYRASEDEEFLAEILPMLEWAWNVQKNNLINNMLPFNGDETYVAGGILPRTTLNDGSAEATLLFITGGELLLSWIEKKGLWQKDKLDESYKVLEETRNSYLDNFWKEERLITNNPDRISKEQMPRFRHGVCQGCLPQGRISFGWTEKNNFGIYLCPDCFKDRVNMTDDDFGKIFSLKSVSLTPLYINAPIITIEQISQVVDEIIFEYKQTGKLPSKPDGNSSVGYDYGLLLYTLTKLKNPMAELIYKKMLSILDSTGAWVEYYNGDSPGATRCRPWESAINLEAAIDYALSLS